jgi:5-formyltetrahydrofolate cyclo-ligase
MQRSFNHSPSQSIFRQLQTIKTITISRQHRAMTTEAQAAKKALRKEIKSRLSSLSEDEIATQSEQAQKVILNLDKYKQAKSLSIYLSMPAAEAQTDLLVRDALRSGKQVFVPFLYAPTQDVAVGGGKPRKVMDLLRLNSESEYDGLSKDAWGIPSLSADSVGHRENAMGGKGLTLVGDRITDGVSEGNAGGLDLVVVPAVAFDTHLDRLGHGAGFYDAFLTRFCSQGKCAKPYLGEFHSFWRIKNVPVANSSQVGLCLTEQILGHEHKIPTAEWDWKVDAVAVGDGSVRS